MLPHDLLIHFLGALSYIIRESRVMAESIFQAFADKAVYLLLQGRVFFLPQYDTAQWDRAACSRLPEFSQVHQFHQAFLLVSETVFMNDDPAIHLSGQYSFFDTGED